jgi:isocitrate/isopropylmalate dehydrogenase
VNLTINGTTQLVESTTPIIAKDPEQDVLNFANALAHITSRSMYLEGNGIKTAKRLIREAIDQGIAAHRAAEAGPARAAGGSAKTGR